MSDDWWMDDTTLEQAAWGYEVQVNYMGKRRHRRVVSHPDNTTSAISDWTPGEPDIEGK